MDRFIVRDRETGTVIETSASLSGAIDLLNSFEEQDKNDGIYEENFYEIYDTLEERII